MLRVSWLLAAMAQVVPSPAPPLEERPPPGSPRELAAILDLPRLRDWRVLQASGFDRDGGFYDSGNFQRIEDGGARWVLLDTKGPGCIDRIWTTAKHPFELDLVVLIDGKRAVSGDRERLFPADAASAIHPELVPPLAGRSTPLAAYSYVPFPFRESCRIVLEPRTPPPANAYRTNARGERIPHVYWQVTYRVFPEGLRLAPESPVARARELDEARKAWTAGLEKAGPLAGPWADLPPVPPGSDRVENRAVPARLPAHGTATLLDEAGPGIVTALRLRAEGLTADERARIRIEASVDGEKEPGIAAPLDGYFAVGQSSGAVRGLLAGGSGERFYSYLPVPFRERVAVRLVSSLEREVSIDADLRFRKLDKLPEDFGFLGARGYAYLNAPRGEDLVLLEAKGRGHLVGCVMIDVGNMEGDERIEVDGRPASEFHGTGTEDYLNFAWGLSHRASFPLHGLNASSTATGGHANGYRFHLTDAVPFRKSIRFTIEHGHGNEDSGSYRGVVFWYQAR